MTILGENSGEYWSGISVDRGASATLEHVIVERGGGIAAPGSANISAATPISLQNSLLRGSLGYGLARRATDTTDYTLTNTFTGNQSGALGTF